MGNEMVRKFLVKGTAWKYLSITEDFVYRQGYLNFAKERTVCVRTMGCEAYITIKGITDGIQRKEFEYEIPLKDADYMLDLLCEKPIIEKIRRGIQDEDCTEMWVVDEYFGENQGLVLAEILGDELEHEGEATELPKWIGEEVTHDPKYFNANLIKYPYSRWK